MGFPELKKFQEAIDIAYRHLSEATCERERIAAVHEIEAAKNRMDEAVSNARGYCNIRRPIPWAKRELVEA